MRPDLHTNRSQLQVPSELQPSRPSLLFIQFGITILPGLCRYFCVREYPFSVRPTLPASPPSESVQLPPEKSMRFRRHENAKSNGQSSFPIATHLFQNFCRVHSHLRSRLPDAVQNVLRKSKKMKFSRCLPPQVEVHCLVRKLSSRINAYFRTAHDVVRPI